jgi:hypothetical protein
MACALLDHILTGFGLMVAFAVHLGVIALLVRIWREA